MDAEKLRRAIDMAKAEKGWSYKELAAHAGVNPQTISNWVTGKVMPETTGLHRIAVALGKQLSTFTDVIQLTPLEDKPISRNEREYLLNFTYHRTPVTGATKLEGWEGVAAGPSREVERAEQPIFIIGQKLPSDHRYFKIHGDSMTETLHDSDIVIVKDLGERGLTLPALKQNQKKTPVDEVKRRVPNKAIALLSIDYGGLTVKRVKYSISPNNHWHLMLLADNAHADDMYPYPVPREKEVTFWALVVGVAKPG